MLATRLCSMDNLTPLFPAVDTLVMGVTVVTCAMHLWVNLVILVTLVTLA